MNYTQAYRELCSKGVSTTEARKAIDDASEKGEGFAGKWSVTYTSKSGFILEES